MFRMESREKCDEIINIFNGKLISGSTQPLLVKFADGGNKNKRQHKTHDQRWREADGPGGGLLSYDSSVHANGLPALLSQMHLGRNFPHHHHHQHHMSPFPIGPNGAPWLPQDIVQPPMQQVNDHHALHHPTFRGELEPTTRWQMEMITSGMDPSSLQYIPQLAPHLSSLHVGNPGNPYGHLQAAGPAGGHGGHHSHHHHHHGGYPIYTGGQSAAATAVSAAAVMPATLSLANESDAASTAASPDDSFSYGMDTYF